MASSKIAKNIAKMQAMIMQIYVLQVILGNMVVI